MGIEVKRCKHCKKKNKKILHICCCREGTTQKQRRDLDCFQGVAFPPTNPEKEKSFNFFYYTELALKSIDDKWNLQLNPRES